MLLNIIIFLWISIGTFCGIALFYALRRINQYENFILNIQNIVSSSTKRMKQVETFAGLVDRKMNMGAAVDIDDLQLLSSEYLKLKEKGVDVSGLDNKINSIKKNYKINQKIKEKGKDPLQERLGKEKEA